MPKSKKKSAIDKGTKIKRFSYEQRAWIDSRTGECYGFDASEKKEITDQRFFSAYRKLIAAGGCREDLIRKWYPWMSYEEVSSRIRKLKKMARAQGFVLPDLPAYKAPSKESRSRSAIDFSKYNLKSCDMDLSQPVAPHEIHSTTETETETEAGGWNWY